MNGSRLDTALVNRGLANSRERAKEYIQNGFVFVNSNIITKPSATVLETDEIRVEGEKLKYVGRGGLKMETAVNAFNLDLTDKICADLGASTGGFTDCMLLNGAKKVFAIDVGHGQLAQKIVEDSRVINIEGVNVKDVSRDMLDDEINFVSADLSFISCKHAIDAALRILADNGEAVILIKPQFEAGKANISKGGIVKDKKAHLAVLNDICGYINSNDLTVMGLVSSGIKGGDGNVEYLVHIVKQKNFTSKIFDLRTIIDNAFIK